MNATRWTGWMGALALVSLPAMVRADAGDEGQRLMQSRATERYSVAVPGASIRAGGGMTAVHAPLSVVEKVVGDYAHYADFMPRFQKSRIVGKTAEGTDVYLQVPILHGAATVWAVTRFAPPVKDANGERIEARMNGQGNVDDMRAVWRLKAIDDTHTLLKLELLIVPKLPLPGSVVTPELEYAADQAVTSARDRAEANAKRAAQAAAGDAAAP